MRGLGRNLVCVLVAVSAINPIFAEPRLLPVAEEDEEQQQPGSPVCEEFFGRWEVPGMPPAMLAMAGIGRELIAAQDCIEKDNVPMACQHWSKVLEVTDKLGAPFDQDRGGIEELMAEHKCEPSAQPVADPEAGSSPDAAD